MSPPSVMKSSQPVLALSILTLVSAVLYLITDHFGLRFQVYFFKPLTMVFIITIAWLATSQVSPLYQKMIIGGLIFSIIGDVLLMISPKMFVYGLVSFLIAHFFYIGAFAFQTARIRLSLNVIPLCVYAVMMVWIVLPHLGNLLLPVLVYMAALFSMAFLAVNRWNQSRDFASLMACCGALLFVVSDSLLSINKFNGQFPGSGICVMGTYFAAQYLIARSI